MRDPDNLLGVLEQLYESVLDVRLWPRAMRSLADFVDARGTFYLTADLARQAIVHGECEGLDPSLPGQYVDYYASREIRLAPALKFPVGRGFTETELVDRRVYERSEIYGDFLVPNDIPHIYGLWVTRGSAMTSAFIFERSRRQGRFERNDVQRCSVVVPHLVRALHARDLIERARERERLSFQLLDRLPIGIVLLDASMRVIEASSRARALFDEHSTLVFESGRIRALHAADDATLQQAIKAATSHTSDGRTPGRSINLRRVNTGTALHVMVLPVRDASTFAVVRPAAALFLSPHSSGRTQDTVGRVGKTLGLTQAEAQLAWMLSTGMTLREAADTLQRSVNTCKSQLKEVYAKLGCRNHVELAKALEVRVPR